MRLILMIPRSGDRPRSCGEAEIAEEEATLSGWSSLFARRATLPISPQRSCGLCSRHSERSEESVVRSSRQPPIASSPLPTTWLQSSPAKRAEVAETPKESKSEGAALLSNAVKTWTLSAFDRCAPPLGSFASCESARPLRNLLCKCAHSRVPSVSAAPRQLPRKRGSTDPQSLVLTAL